MEHKGLLSGMKVLDLSRVLAAPYCGMMLADLGAEVIKIERPGKGDDARSNFPIVNGESAYYMNLNRNKRGIVLNLKSQAGKEVFRKLVAQSDVVLENYRPGVMDRLGLGYEELRKINPAIIYASVSGFGHYGPYHERAGYDIVGQAISGLMSTTGWPDSAPTRTGTAIADVMGGISCCVGILAAYINRLKTGEGEKVDVALVDSMVSLWRSSTSSIWPPVRSLSASATAMRPCIPMTPSRPRTACWSSAQATTSCMVCCAT